MAASDETKRKELFEAFTKDYAAQREQAVKDCEHALALKLSSYSARGADGTGNENVEIGLLIECDVCKKILGQEAYCFHCTKCKMWDVCFKCRTPTDEELDKGALGGHVVYITTSNDTPKLIQTNDNADLLHKFVADLCKKVPDTVASKIHVTTRREYINLLSQ